MPGYKIGKHSKAATIRKEIGGKLALTLRDCGVYESDLGRVIREGLSATRILIIKEQEVVDGRVVTKNRILEVPDHPTRVATMVKTAHLGDYFPAKKLDISDNRKERPFSGISQEVLEKRARELRKKNEVDAEYEVVTEPGENESGRAGALPS